MSSSDIDSDLDIAFSVHESDLEPDMDPAVLDYMSDSSLQIEEIKAPKPDGSVPGAVVVLNLPKVKKDKAEKLQGILKEIIDKKCNGAAHKLTMPFNNTGQSFGFAIIEFTNPELVPLAIRNFDSFKLDASYTFRCVKFDDVPNYVNMQDQMPEYVGPTRFSRKKFRDWLEIGAGKEQILLRYQDETEIYWLEAMQGSLDLVYGGEREKKNLKLWCDSQVHWSPHGSYLMTFHKQGIALWGNDKFEKQIRFSHENVRDACFSPNEDYLMTWNGTHANVGDPAAVRFFTVLTGQEIKGFPTPTVSPMPGKTFPHFLWSHDGTYVAKCSDKDFSVYEIPTMDLVKGNVKKAGCTLPVEGLSSFAWSPKDNLISIWVDEKKNSPARLMILNMPNLEELASRSRTQCGAEMIWQSEGDFLCLVITKMSKSNKGKKGSSVEIFRIREKNIPVETVELKDLVKGFFWETRGKRFALITEPEVGNPRLAFYSLDKDKCDMVASMELPSASYNQVFWAPEGEYFIVASIPGGDLLWGQLSSGNRLEILYKDEHFMLNHVQWDPSSRYVLTGCVQPMLPSSGANQYKVQMESGFSIWTFQGRLLYKQQKEKLWDCSWRPHPRTLCSEKELESCRKKMKDYSRKYDQEDEQGREQLRAIQKKVRDDGIREFTNILANITRHFMSEKKRTGWDEAEQNFNKFSVWDIVDTTVEELIEEKVEIMN